MTSPDYFDDLETRDPETRETALLSRLASQIANAQAKSPFFAEFLQDIDATAVNSRKALAALPVVRKSDLIEYQRNTPPFGGLTTCAPGELKRIFQSSGPIYDPEGYGDDWWRSARALFAAGIRKGDILHNAFSYHLNPAGVMAETGAAKIGCAVIPAGDGNMELQVRAIANIRPNGFLGTPSTLKTLLLKAQEMGADVSCLKKGLVAGEAFPPHLRIELQEFGVICRQMYATADIGNIAFESPAEEGLIIDEGLLVEVVHPGTGELVEDGQVGEVLVTTFAPEYPLIRFATGDLSCVLEGISPCGRTNTRLKGWMGRADQATKVKGLFVHPQQITDIVNRHPEVTKARLVVDQRDGRDVMTLSCEVKNPHDAVGGDASLLAEITDSIEAVCKLSAEVGFAAPGSLPNDGKIIDDIRRFDD